MVLRSGMKPTQLVENRTSYGGPQAEFSIYDTYLPARKVALNANELLYCGMISGRKIMHSPATPSQTFVPHESFVMAPGAEVSIDFPDASLQRPTRCLTLEISREKVQRIADRLYANYPSQPTTINGLTAPALHTHHTPGTQQLLERLANLFTHNDPDRDVSIEYGIGELIARLLRHQERDFLLSAASRDPQANAIHAALHHLRAQLHQPIDMDQLCRIACMSRSKFFALFKRQLGCTPAELQQKLRLERAAELLKQGKTATEAGFSVGFNSASHFCRRFQQHFGVAPSCYKRH